MNVNKVQIRQTKNQETHIETLSKSKIREQNSAKGFSGRRSAHF